MTKRVKITKVVLLVLVLILCGCESKEPVSKSESETRAEAPKFTLTNYDGKTIKLSDYKGKIVVLEWFNYECPFVKYHYDKARTMSELADKYKDRNVVWLAINSTAHQTTEKNKEFADKYKIGYPILDDKSGTTGRAYQAQKTPHMFIIDTKGMIAYSGAIDNSPLGKNKDGVINYVDQALAELTSGKTISASNTEPYGCSVKYVK